MLEMSVLCNANDFYVALVECFTSQTCTKIFLQLYTHTCRGTQKTHNKTLYFNTSKDSSDTIKKKTAEKM